MATKNENLTYAIAEKIIIALAIIGILFSLFGCKNTKPLTSTTVKKDSTVVLKEIRIHQPTFYKATIDSICPPGSQAKPFKQEIRTEYVKVYIESKDNKISAEVDIQKLIDSIKTTYELKLKDNVKEIPVEIPVPYRDKWFWIGWIFSLVLLIWYNKELIIKFILKFIKPI